MATKSKKSPKAAPKKPAKKPPVKPAKTAVAPASKAKKPAPQPVKKAKPAPVVKKAKTPAAPAKNIAPTANHAAKNPPLQSTGFLAKQRARLLTLKDTLLDSMNGVAKDSLRSRAEGSEASAFGMHQADAGSDAYDRDFALSLLSQEQDSLYEIDEALKRIATGSYGICEISGKPILHARLEALPFTRYTVECQAEIEKKNRYSRVRQPVASLFGLGDDEGGEGDDDDSSTDSKD
ncbi:MAG: TraR/DksA C4-type zinc finger protein [Terrimicrobiaceae bacterium]|jgi:RNA polymerase-binding transcription factor DksA|nr:TraR/DksA C4-type zinc finger protein [Terrimicrobiaceae bacterium]